MEYCPHCMQPTAEETCPNCGHQVHCENNEGLLRVGTVLCGNERNYLIGAAIGQGGFGVTYVGLDLTENRRVAIKEYFPVYCAHRTADGQVEPMRQDEIYESGRFSFLQEAKMLASLEGMPAVVQGLDYLETNNTAYLVMEYLDGTPLYQVVEKKGRILAEELMPMLKPLLRDIGKLHEAGVIHRDISPDNIMWMPDNTLKLLDFGCARSMEVGKSMTVLIKKGFAPPEQYQRHGQGAYTDVYALAATIYYCLTGVVPPESVLRIIEGAELKSPIALGAALTPEEESALMWGLEVSPKARPANMDAFSKRLFPLEEEPVQERPPFEPGPVEKLQPGRPVDFGSTHVSKPKKVKGWVVAVCIVAVILACIVTSSIVIGIFEGF